MCRPTVPPCWPSWPAATPVCTACASTGPSTRPMTCAAPCLISACMANRPCASRGSSPWPMAGWSWRNGRLGAPPPRPQRRRVRQRCGRPCVKPAGTRSLAPMATGSPCGPANAPAWRHCCVLTARLWTPCPGRAAACSPRCFPAPGANGRALPGTPWPTRLTPWASSSTPCTGP